MILYTTCPVRLPSGLTLWVHLSRLDYLTWVGWVDRGSRRLPNGRLVRLLEPVTAGTLEGLLSRARALASQPTSRSHSRA